MTKPESKWMLLPLLVAVLVLADQWTKFLAVADLTTAFARVGDCSVLNKIKGFYAFRNLEPLARAPVDVWKDFWRMRYAENPGSAFGLFRALSPGLRLALFSVVTVAAVVFILGAHRKLREHERIRQVALSLVLAGALGNFVDRLARRYVIDFIDWGIGDLRWPTFNLADVFVVVGVGLVLLPLGGDTDDRHATGHPPVRK